MNAFATTGRVNTKAGHCALAEYSTHALQAEAAQAACETEEAGCNMRARAQEASAVVKPPQAATPFVTGLARRLDARGAQCAVARALARVQQRLSAHRTYGRVLRDLRDAALANSVTACGCHEIGVAVARQPLGDRTAACYRDC